MSAGHDDYAVEPIRGLPEMLPQDEKILWQGAPEVWEMAKHVFHIRLAAAYLLGLTAWRFSIHLQMGNTGAAVIAALSLLTISLLGLGLLWLMAFLCSRTSVYTITSKRVVLRIGVALPTAVNLPFSMIGAAELRAHANGAGDIALSLTGDERLAWSNFWPHVRPWRINRPQPMLRGVADVRAVAQLLSEALAAAAPQGAVRTAPVQQTAGHAEPRHAATAAA